MIALWLGAGQTLSAQMPVSEALVRCAREAKARADGAALRACLRGWASLGSDSVLPGLEREAQEAIEWARKAGRFAVFGSRLPKASGGPRVRVGIKDPAELVGRVDVYAVLEGKRVRLKQLVSGGVGRLEYQLPLKGPQAEVIMEVFTKNGALLTRSTLAGGAEVPSAPDIKAIEAKLAPKAAPKAPEPKPALAWWWIAAGVVAAALVGTAVWHETREF